MLPLHPWLRCARFCHWPPSASPLRSFACCTGTLLTRVARPPPLDARLHLPFVTSTHRSILGVTFAAESALVLPLLAGLHRYHTTRVASLLQHSHIYSLLTLTMIFSTPVLSSLMSPLSRTFIITSSKYRTLFALTSPSVFGCYPHS